MKGSPLRGCELRQAKTDPTTRLNTASAGTIDSVGSACAIDMRIHNARPDTVGTMKIITARSGSLPNSTGSH